MAAVPAGERAARGARNAAWAMAHLHWERLIDRYITHFEQIIARSPSRRRTA
jgi:hypothetical protein